MSDETYDILSDKAAVFFDRIGRLTEEAGPLQRSGAFSLVRELESVPFEAVHFEVEKGQSFRFEHPEKARERVADFLVMYDGPPSCRAMLDREGASGPEDIAAVGTAAAVADRLVGVSESGVTTITVSEIGDPDELAATREVLVSLLEVV